MNFKINLSEKSKEELIDIIINKEKKIEELERELKKYKNPNTPSSSNKHIKPNTQGFKAEHGAKRGAPVGHKGTTLNLPSAEEIIPVFAHECANCGSPDVELTGNVKEKVVVCLIKPKTIVKKYLQAEMRCFDCHNITLALHKDIPERGIYDKTIQSLVNYFKFKSRLPHNLIVDCMNSVFNVPMTAATSLNITRRGSDKLEQHYRRLEQKIKKQDVINADETICSVNGVNHWMWIFCNELLSLFKFNKERGGDIVEKTLGKNFTGKIVSDGWKTYSVYCSKNKVIHGRCWSHGLREVKHECKVKHPSLYKWFCDIFDMTKKGKAESDENKRPVWFEKCKAELSMWITHAEVHQNLRKLTTKIKNGADDWFTAILHPEVPLDNNEAERSLRPFVVVRKIIGCLRSDIGKRNYEVMMSLISTWQKQNKNVFYTLQATL